MSRPQETIEVSEWLEELPDVYWMCRDVGHAWGGSQTLWKLGWGLKGRALRCLRCGARKEQLLSEGAVHWSRMEYPTDYVKPKNVRKGRVTRAQVRDVALTHAEVAKGDPPEVLGRMFSKLTSLPTKKDKIRQRAAGAV